MKVYLYKIDGIQQKQFLEKIHSNSGIPQEKKKKQEKSQISQKKKGSTKDQKIEKKINKTKSWPFQSISKIDKPLAKLPENKERESK